MHSPGSAMTRSKGWTSMLTSWSVWVRGGAMTQQEVERELERLKQQTEELKRRAQETDAETRILKRRVAETERRLERRLARALLSS